MEDVFRVSIASSKHEGELGEFETAMQTRDAVEGLHNMETPKKVLYCFYKIFLKDDSKNDGKCCFFTS